MNTIVKTQIFLPTAEIGGRTSPPYSGYFPTVYFNLKVKKIEHKTNLTETQRKKSASFESQLLYNYKEVPLGKKVECYLNIDASSDFMKRLKIGDEFYLCELIRIVGWGRIVETGSTLPSNFKEHKEELTDRQKALLNNIFQSKPHSTSHD